MFSNTLNVFCVWEIMDRFKFNSFSDNYSASRAMQCFIITYDYLFLMNYAKCDSHCKIFANRDFIFKVYLLDKFGSFSKHLTLVKSTVYITYHRN